MVCERVRSLCGERESAFASMWAVMEERRWYLRERWRMVAEEAREKKR